MQYKRNQRKFLFLSFEAVMFLFFCPTEARHVLRMFLIFSNFEPQRSYKHGSYSRKSVYFTQWVVYSCSGNVFWSQLAF